MKRLVTFLLLVLAGCTSPEDMLTEQPFVAFNTSVKAEEVRDCLISGHPSFHVSTTQAGYTVFYAIEGTPPEALWLVKIDRTPTGSHVETHRRHGLMHVPYEDQVQPCLDKLTRL